LFRLFRKKVLVVFVGTDVRPAFMNGGIFGDGSRASLEFGIRKMRYQRLKVQLAEIFSNDIVSNAAISQYQHEDFVDWFWIGIPMERVDVKENERDTTGRIRILHSPSDPLAKGSGKIRAMVDRMIAKGYPIDYTEIKGRPHIEVVDELRRTDLIIDQMYSDSPMATFAAEAAMYGVPALVGGYYAGHISNGGSGKKVPTIYCHPDSMEVALEELLQHPDRLMELGKVARAFVSEQWERGQVAKRIVKIFDGELEEEHFLSPYDNDYVLGSGLSKDVVLRNCHGIMERKGVRGFGLWDKPRLMLKIFELIGPDHRFP
jgi:glycosyltransferase involved in cell wall biosynthesis